jgi:hypothetical protein
VDMKTEGGLLEKHKGDGWRAGVNRILGVGHGQSMLYACMMNAAH